MTPAAAATAIRAAIEEGCRKDPEYLALVLRELADIPVPADAKERGWTKIAAALTEGVSAPQPAVGNSGSVGLGVLYPLPRVTTLPCQGGASSAALAKVGDR